MPAERKTEGVVKGAGGGLRRLRMEAKESGDAQRLNEKPLRLLTFSGKMLIALNASCFGAISSTNGVASLFAMMPALRQP